MNSETILRQIVAEEFAAATESIAQFCSQVQEHDASSLQGAVLVLSDALVAARSIRSHQSKQAEQLAAASRFLAPRPGPVGTVDLFG